MGQTILESQSTLAASLSEIWQQMFNFTSYTAESFAENLTAGLVIMIVEIILVVGLLGVLVDYFQRRSWNRTRQALAYVLLGSMTRVFTHALRALHVEADKVIVLNYQFELHLLKMEKALENFNEQVIVHLPALLPPISVNLSKITRKVSKLEEAVAALKYHFYNIEKSIDDSDMDNRIPNEDETQYWIRPECFEEKLNRMHLKKEELPTEQKFLVLSLFEMFELSSCLSDDIKVYIDYRSRNWKGFEEETPGKAVEKENIMAIQKLEILKFKSLLKDLGIHLVKYRPPSDQTPISNEEDH
ncbi:MAG: hypothetical protein VYA55_15675 [Pseudomonadota bacterium]|nr:hypothetical protein [Pseudomonadota bacterium]